MKKKHSSVTAQGIAAIRAIEPSKPLYAIVRATSQVTGVDTNTDQPTLPVDTLRVGLKHRPLSVPRGNRAVTQEK